MIDFLSFSRLGIVMGRREFSGNDSSTQVSWPIKWSVWQFQRWQEWWFPRQRQTLLPRRATFRQLLEGRRLPRLFNITTRHEPFLRASMQTILAGQNWKRPILQCFEILAFWKMCGKSRAPILLWRLQIWHVWVPRGSVPLRGFDRIRAWMRIGGSFHWKLARCDGLSKCHIFQIWRTPKVKKWSDSFGNYF